MSLPRVDWGARKLIGYEINPLPGNNRTFGDRKPLSSLCRQHVLAHFPTSTNPGELCPADGTLHESSIQCYEVHEKMRTSWPDPKLTPGYR